MPDSQIECPSCHKLIPIYKNEVQWCDLCEWNLYPPEEKTPNAYQRIYRSIGKKISQNLFITLKVKSIAKPRITISKIAAIAIAGAIHLMPVILLSLCCFAFAYLSILVAVVISLILFSGIILTFPRLRKWPKDTVTRERAPNLYNLLDRISDEMRTSKTSGLIIDENFNAYYSEFGFGPWKKKLIGLGLPLATYLTAEEIVAVLSHETSHGANGDVSRGAFIGSALSTLEKWYFILTPTQINEGYQRGVGIFVSLGNFLGFLLGRIPWMLYYILAHLLLRQSQEAEYLADGLAISVCGTDSMISLLEKIPRRLPFEVSVSKAALSNGEIDVFDEIRRRYQFKISKHDQERNNRIEIKNGLSLDSTHPPTPYRRDFILSENHVISKINLDRETSIKIIDELKSFESEVGKKLVDQYLHSIS